MKRSNIVVIGILCLAFSQLYTHALADNAVGSMGGQFSVSPMGGATYSIPIEVPQGVGGLQPQLSIVYNSQSGNGLCGYGANLSGISAITRGPKDIYHDGTAKGVTYLADDALYLDGVRLILSSGTAGQNNAIYHPESDPFTTVTAKVTNGNTLHFEVESSDGMTYLYGSNQYSRLDYIGSGGVQKTHSWYLDCASQPNGNYIDYIYSKNGNCIYPGLIMYGSNSTHNNYLSNIITFTYNQSRADSIPVVFDGQHGSMKYLLTDITCTTNDSVFRSYTLNYDSTSDNTAYKFSRLTSVTEKNGQNQSLPPTQLHWSYLPQISYLSNSFYITPATNIPSSITTNDNVQIIEAGDLNEDGISDVIKIVPAEEQDGNSTLYYTIVNIFYSSVNASGQVSFSTADDYYNIGFVGNFACTTLSMKGRMIVDIDGDGVNELLIPIYKASDGSLSSRVRFYVIGQNYNCEYCNIITSPDIDPLFTSSDIDNDGKSEIIYLETIQTNGLYRLTVMKNLGQNSVLQQCALFELSLSSKPRYVFLTDMNNNGLKDLLIVCQNNYTVYWNQGGYAPTSIYSDSFKTASSDFGYWHTTAPGDYNGDGLMDFLTTAVGSNAWKLFINNGNGTFTMNTACSLDLYEQDFTTYDDDQFHCEVMDFDGDGRDDVVITKAMYNDYGYHVEFNKTHTFWMRSTGASLEQVYHATSNKASDAKNNVYMTGDFDGDGRMELANYGYDCVSGINANTDASWHIYRNSGFTAQTGKVTSISGDFGVTTNITYSTLTDSTIYTRGTSEPYPAPRYTIPLNVVKQTVQNNGAAGNLTTQYSYSGLKIHLRGRGLLGFSKTTVDCTTTGVSTESAVTQWDSNFFIPRASYTKTIVGSDTAKTETILEIEDMGSHKYFTYPSFSMTRDMDGNLTYNYWTFNTVKGYIESESTVYGTEMFRSVSYQNYTTSKVGGVYRPQRIVTSQQHPDDESLFPVFSVTTTYTYDSSTGAVTSKVENYGTSKPLTTSYTYDSWGNILSQQSTGSGITNCTTYYSYDQTHRFPVRIYTYPASSVMKYTYDVFGNVLSEQDSINSSISNTVTHTYNAWGQLIRTDMPDGTSSTYTRGWNNNAGKRYFILTQGTATPWVKTWYDNHGREVMTESIGPLNVSVTSSTTYDSKGLVTNHNETSGNLSLNRSYQYDSRGRVVRETAPGNAVTTYQYGNRTVAVTKNSRTTTTTYDAWGNVKTVTAPISSISNNYASNGNISETQSGGATWTFGYDDRGNRTSMTDPDAGTTVYVYDALGRETSRTDGRGVVFVTKYDYLGRVTQRKADTDAINYTYWTSGNGQLSLKSESNGTWTKSYAYDNLRRVTSETMTNGTVTKTKTYQYGTNGLLSERTVPGGMTYEYTYDTYGNLTGVDFESGTVEWNLTGYTGKNMVSATVIDGYTGYPFTKTTALDSNGMLDYISTNQLNWYVQDDDYYFSPQTGNLMSMNGMNWTYPLIYNYDNADRLTTVQENNQTIMSVAYSANGNITSKLGMGNYTYSTTTRPHAVTAVDNTDDILTMNDQEVSYDSWGKVSSVWQTDNTNFYYHIIEYGPDLKRVTSKTDKTYNNLYDKFYWDDYEERKVGNDLYQYYYVYGGDGLAGLHIVKTSPNNQIETQTTKVITDHLGSITSLLDISDWVYNASFDVWGNREVDMQYQFDPYFDRGFTGHEHLLDEFGLINMNGRMYDPNLGRFLSPDNYIQSPYNPQNYNRYSYCLNNPLKFTDPSGNNFAETILTGIIDFFTTAFFKGGLDFSSPGSMREAWRNYDPTAPWSKTNKSWKMSIGFYTLDTNKSSWGQAWQLISRFTWESPQTLLGGTVNQIHNIFGGVKSVGYCCGATVVESYAEGWGAFTIGNFINGNRGIQASIENSLFRHEYGHYLQSMSWGPLYIPRFGLPSLWDAIGDETLAYPVEVDANKRAFNYFSKYINGFTTYDEQSNYWTSKWKFEVNPISSDYNLNNARSGMSSWKEGLLRFKWYDFIANDPFGFINHNIVYQIMKYK